MVEQAASTLTFIKQLVRQLTNSPGQYSLPESVLEQAINTFYNNDFPYAIKIDQQRSLYTIYTQPYIDRYPIDVNYIQGIRSPVYFDGIQGGFYKDRTQFYNLWPRITTQFQESGQTLTGTITGIAQPTNPCQITSPSHNLSTGAVITISNVGGMTQLNGNYYTVTVINANTFSLNGVDNTAYGAYTSGGTWEATSQTFSFTIQGPFLSREIQIGGLSTAGTGITINDDGNGNLIYLSRNPQTSTPAQNSNPATPGMYNQNLNNPGLYQPTVIGTVNYVSGLFNFTLPVGISLASGEVLTIRVSQYQPGRPYSMLFFNNELIIRPVPKVIHKVECEVFLTPVQFMADSNHPILNQWAQTIAYGVAAEIQRRRNDFDGVAKLQEGYQRQMGMVLERQGIEEIFTPNFTLFNSTTPNPYLSNYWGLGIM